MADRVQAAIAALRDALDGLNRPSLVQASACCLAAEPAVRHAARVVSLCERANEASSPPAAPIGLGHSTIQHPVLAPKAALDGMIRLLGEAEIRPASIAFVSAIVDRLRQSAAALDAVMEERSLQGGAF